MLDVIGAGLPRTGTSSMKAALERLGFGPCYHMYEILTHPGHVDHWLPVASGEPMDWERVFDGYRSTQDWPASHFYRELAELYPEAKVILTVRDPVRWHASMQTLIDGPRSLAARDVPPAAAQVLGQLRRMMPVMDTIRRAAMGPDFPMTADMPPVEVSTEFFDLHTETVKRIVPAERLLVVDVREGWEPLCAFLGVAVPEEPFPHLNDRDTIRNMMSKLVEEGVVSSPFDRR